MSDEENQEISYDSIYSKYSRDDNHIDDIKKPLIKEEQNSICKCFISIFTCCLFY